MFLFVSSHMLYWYSTHQHAFGYDICIHLFIHSFLSPGILYVHLPLKTQPLWTSSLRLPFFVVCSQTFGHQVCTADAINLPCRLWHPSTAWSLGGPYELHGITTPARTTAMLWYTHTHYRLGRLWALRQALEVDLVLERFFNGIFFWFCFFNAHLYPSLTSGFHNPTGCNFYRRTAYNI